MTPDEQRAALAEHLGAGWDYLRELLDDPARRRVIERSAIKRHEKGLEVFGDTGWRTHPDGLMVEMIEEMADLLVYAAMRSWRRRGGPGV